MINVMVTYKVKKEKVGVVKKAIVKFVNKVKRREQGTLVYQALQQGKNSFVHFMTFKDKKAKKIHEDSSHVEKFVNILYPCMQGKLRFINLRLIRSK